MTMLFVIPIEKLLTKAASILKAAEPVGELRAIFKRFKMGFGELIVVADIGPVERFGVGRLNLR
jgi:hypothetical protein